MVDFISSRDFPQAQLYHYMQENHESIIHLVIIPLIRIPFVKS